MRLFRAVQDGAFRTATRRRTLTLSKIAVARRTGNIGPAHLRGPLECIAKNPPSACFLVVLLVRSYVASVAEHDHQHSPRAARWTLPPGGTPHLHREHCLRCRPFTVRPSLLQRRRSPAMPPLATCRFALATSCVLAVRGRRGLSALSPGFGGFLCRCRRGRRRRRRCCRVVLTLL